MIGLSSVMRPGRGTQVNTRAGRVPGRLVGRIWLGTLSRADCDRRML
jgi:hypothetical protein